jgi:hypothetical protein
MDWQGVFSVAAVPLALVIVFLTPRRYILEYAEWAKKRFGGVAIAIVMTIFPIGSALILCQPGRYPLFEFGVEIGSAILFGGLALDNLYFWRTHYRKK